MTNDQIADAIALTAKLMELTGESSFKVKAYDNAADALYKVDESIADTLRAGKPLEIEGVGSSTATAIRQLVETGTTPVLDKLKAEVPAGVIELSKIRGLGPKKLVSLWKEHGITTPEGLHQSIVEGKLEKMKGFGAKSVQGIYDSLAYYFAHRGSMRLDIAERLARQVRRALETLPNLTLEVTGDLRRWMPTISRLEWVATGATTEQIADALKASDIRFEEVQVAGTQVTGLTAKLQQVVVHCVDKQHFAASLAVTTGPEVLGKQLNANSTADTEAAVFAEAGLRFVAPELRDLPLAELPTPLPQLVEVTDIRGILHTHSTWSDGTRTLRDMADACKAAGYQYLGISDHSRTAAYAGGLSIERVAAQHADIDALNAELGSGFRIFKGIESDILVNGDLDYPAEVLETFDFVVASIHSGFQMDVEAATARLIRAIENPYTRILGHMTGRLLLAREGYPIGHKRVIDACAANGVAIELNSDPYRLDIDWTWIPYALKKGVWISLNPDAHNAEDISYVRYGVLVGRKGLLPANRTLNALDVDGFEQWLRNKKG